MLELAESQKEALLAIGLSVFGLGILIYVVVIRPDAADRKRLESGSAEPAGKPVHGCIRVIVYLIITLVLAIIFGVLIGMIW